MLDRLNQTEKMNKASGDIFNWSSNSLPRKVFPSKIRLTLYPNLTTRTPTNKIYVYHNAYIKEPSAMSVEFWVVKLKRPIIWNNHLLWLPWRIHVPFPLLRRLQMGCDTAFGCICVREPDQSVTGTTNNASAPQHTYNECRDASAFVTLHLLNIAKVSLFVLVKYDEIYTRWTDTFDIPC